MALPSNALTNMETARGELLGLSSAKDSLLERLIAVASDSIERHLGRTLYYSAAITETTIGLGGHFLFLSRTPLVSITSITLDGSAITSSTYSIHNATSGMVYREGGWSWTATETDGLAAPDYAAGTEQKLFSVVYAGGWITPSQVEADSQLTRTLPYDVEQACLDTVVHLFRGRGRARNLHKEAADVAGQSMSGGLPDSALELLEPYRRVACR